MARRSARSSAEDAAGWEIFGLRLGALEIILLLILLALILRIGAFYLFPNVYNAVIYQYLEQANRAVYGDGLVPWEYRVGLRSWVLPGFMAGIVCVSDFFFGRTVNYEAVSLVFILISVSLIPMAFYRAGRLEGMRAALLAGLIMATWYALIYFAPKALATMTAAYVLFAAVMTVYPKEPDNTGRLIAAGLLIGLTFVLRMHLAPALAFLVIYACWNRPRAWLTLGASGLTVFVAAGLLDWATWSYPFQSFWLNFKINIIDHKSAEFGTEPFGHYFVESLRLWTWAWLPMVSLALFAARRHWPILAVIILIYLPHEMVPHKENRFLLPALPLMLFLAALGGANLIAVLRRIWPKRRSIALVSFTSLAGFFLVASLILGINEPFGENWTLRRANVEAFEYLDRNAGDEPLGLSGVGFYRWHGQITMSRPRPLYYVPRDEISQGYRAARWFLVRAKDWEPFEAQGLKKQKCFHPARYDWRTCILFRDGPVEPVPHYRVDNIMLRKNI